MQNADFDYEGISFLRDSSSSHLRLGSNSVSSHIPTHNEHLRKEFSTAEINKDVHLRMEKLLSELHATASDVLDNRPLNVSYASVFKSVELLCVYKHFEQSRLADFLFDAIDLQLSRWQIPCLLESDENGNNLDYSIAIQLFVKDFLSWLVRLELLQQLFLYIDRSYLLLHPKKKTLLEYGLNKFADRVLYHDSEKGKILEKVELLLKKIHYECRNVSELVNYPVAGEKESIFLLFFQTIIRLDYHQYLVSSSRLLEIIGSNYKQLKDLWLDQGEEYLVIVLDSLAAESSSLARCGVPQNNIESLLKTLKWALIFSDFEDVLDTCLPSLLRQERYVHLKSIWKLSEIANLEAGFDACRSFTYIWGRFVQKQTQTVVEESKNDPKTLIPNLFSLWERLGKIVETCFNVESMIFETRSAKSKALGNKSLSSYVLVQLTKHCDLFFKLIRKFKDRDLYGQFASEVLAVFKLLPNKAEFILLYERDLSKRMLLGKSFNFSLENKLVDSLLAVIGKGDETSNLLAMFRDLEASKNNYSLIQLECFENTEFNALVLEKKYWPEIPNPISNIVLPDILGQALNEFTERYYKQSEKHKYHKLDWSNHLLHQIILSVPLASGSKELNLNLLQASVLMHFEETERLSITQLLEKTKMDQRQLRKVLTSLSTERYPLLIVGDTDVEFNFQAELKGDRVKIPMIREKEMEAVDDATKVIQKSINPIVRAAIVRLMKQERNITFPELLTRVLDTREDVLVATVKENIEYLITNEYLKRGADGVTIIYIP